MSLESFFVTEQEEQHEGWGSSIEKERRLRIRLAVAAYAYEICSEPIMSDSEFDSLCLRVNLSADTGNNKMDAWFRDNFNPSTGQWIHKHPELTGIIYLWKTFYKKSEKKC